MIYVWDTDTCIYWLKGREEIRRKVREIGESNIGITLITLAELKYGAYSSQRVERNLKNIENDGVEILRAEVFDLGGKRLFDSGPTMGNALD